MPPLNIDISWYILVKVCESKEHPHQYGSKQIRNQPWAKTTPIWAGTYWQRVYLNILTTCIIQWCDASCRSVDGRKHLSISKQLLCGMTYQCLFTNVKTALQMVKYQCHCHQSTNTFFSHVFPFVLIFFFGGFLKWGSPKSPWVSILRWSTLFGWFGVPPRLWNPPFVGFLK